MENQAVLPAGKLMIQNMGLIRLIDSPDAKILIRAANWVGDAIMTTPVVRAVRKNYPLSKMTVLAKPWVVPVYENNPYIDRVMVYESGGRHKMGWGTLRLAADLKDNRFDLGILMQNAFEAALITFLGRVKERLGYNTDARRLLLNRCVRLNPALKKKHLIDYYLGILNGAGLNTDGRQMDLFLSQADQDFAFEWLKIRHNGHSAPVIGINPGATGGTAKRWFPERYARLCEKLSKAYQTRIIIFGGPADHALGNEIAEQSAESCINIAGKTTLGQAFALIEKCDLFVTNDSGLMHAAAALNVNQVTVIGSTDFIATRADSDQAVMVREPVDCSPCLKDVCPTDHRCMDKISVEQVEQACQTVLNRKYV
jgi:heptosyltransferase-2